MSNKIRRQIFVLNTLGQFEYSKDLATFLHDHLIDSLIWFGDADCPFFKNAPNVLEYSTTNLNTFSNVCFVIGTSQPLEP